MSYIGEAKAALRARARLEAELEDARKRGAAVEELERIKRQIEDAEIDARANLEAERRDLLEAERADVWGAEDE